MLGPFAGGPSAVATPVAASSRAGNAAAGTAAAGAGDPGSGSAARAQHLCFETISGPPGRRDVESSTGKAQVVCRTTQEGQRGAAPRTIQFTGQQARISWDSIRMSDPAAAPLPPAVLLPHQACSALKSTSGL